MAPVVPPVAPMLARLARELPVGTGLTYEPKWDGFRCLAFVDPDGVDLRSRHDRPLARYFPEVVTGLERLPPCVLDGELLVPGADFAALMGRLHPAASRVRRLAAEHDDLRDLPHRDRRRCLEALLDGCGSPVGLSPSTGDPEVAQAWLEAPAGSAIDGVVVKHGDDPYCPGKRMQVKVKHERTVDCVLAGFRLFGAEASVGSLLLGLYDGDELRHVGVVTSFARKRRLELLEELAPLATPIAAHPWRDGFALEGGPMGRLRGAAGRWAPGMTMDWVPLRIERVVEVAYTQLDGIRFRHPARFRRWRPDRTPASCTVEQLEQA